MPSSRQRSSSISLCSSWQLPEAPSRLQSWSTPGSKESRSSQDSPPHSWAVTPDQSGWRGARGAHRVGGQWSLMCVYMCVPPFPFGVHWCGALCQLVFRLSNPIQCHSERLEGSVGLAISSPLSIGFIWPIPVVFNKAHHVWLCTLWQKYLAGSPSWTEALIAVE